MPPDECIELMLWDRFGWGPEQTSRFTLDQLRVMFAVIEQQRVSRDAVENLGKPDPDRVQAKVAAANDAKRRGGRPSSNQEKETGPGNAKIIRREMRDLGMGYG
jgi:hypothetical protein